MTPTLKTHQLLCISGSLRAASFNTKLVQEGARLWDGPHALADLRLPLYDGDLEAVGIPQAVTALAAAIEDADAVLIATPEYNKSLSGALKNALDWVSRVKGNPWGGTPVAIVSATAGRSGGERAQDALRLAMNPFQPQLLSGPEVLVATAKDQFDADGRLVNERYLTRLTALIAALRDAASG